MQHNKDILPNLYSYVLERNRTLEISYINYCTIVLQQSILLKISLGSILFKHLHLLIQEYILRYSSSELETSNSYQELYYILTQFLILVQQIIVNNINYPSRLFDDCHVHLKELLEVYQTYYLSIPSNTSEVLHFIFLYIIYIIYYINNIYYLYYIYSSIKFNNMSLYVSIVY